MSGFKLLAIRTGRNLTKEELSDIDLEKLISKSKGHNYIKGLKSEYTFNLFNNYKICIDGSCLEKLNDPLNLYSENELSIEISSIVGMNGSGKSTLLEILYLAINNIAIEKGILMDDRQRVDIPENYLFCDIYFQESEDKYFRINCNYEDKSHNTYVYSSEYNKQTKFYEFIDPIGINDFNFEKLFYSIVVNYSIHGLNDNYTGNWINHLFHKNDSYQTPIVINPMRTNGGFNINKEQEFTRYRLLSNSVRKFCKKQEQIFLTDDLFIDSFDFYLDKRKIEFLEFAEYSTDALGQKTRTIENLITESNISDPDKEIIQPLIKFLYPESKIITDTICIEEIKKYIIKKLYKIAFTYPKYHNFLDNNHASIPLSFHSKFDKNKLSKYFEELSNDNSHVTLKLRQAVIFIINKTLTFNELKFQVGPNVLSNLFSISFEELAKRISNNKSVTEFLPPSIFKNIIYLKSKRTGELIELEKMSSGELQLINSVQSTLYHLNNLDSYLDYTSNSGLIENSNNANFEKIKYNNALIIFDEVELYFHPEYQRKFISFLLDEIKELNLELVKNIHIIFATHSPFILSDIPYQNILRLEYGKPKPYKEKEQTFGANIHDLLANDFFLDKGFIGEFAKGKIEDLINFLKNREYTFSWDIKKIEIFIENIGDTLIQRRLNDLYKEWFNKTMFDTKTLILEKIELEKKLNAINKKLEK